MYTYSDCQSQFRENILGIDAAPPDVVFCAAGEKFLKIEETPAVHFIPSDL